MKSCPTCNRTYPDDTLAFCLMDGAVLSAPYDHQASRHPTDPRRGTPSRTEVMPRGAGSDDNVLPATMPSPPVTTIQVPPPSVPSMDLSDQKISSVRPAESDRLVKMWEKRVGKQSVAGDRIRFVLLRLVGFVLVLSSAFFALRTLQLFLFGGLSRGRWEFLLAHAILTFLLGWGARRCWRLAGSA